MQEKLMERSHLPENSCENPAFTMPKVSMQKKLRSQTLEIGSLTAWVHRMPLKALLGFIFFVNF